MPKLFTETDKAHIRTALIQLGLQSLERHGYRASSVEALAREAGIGKGTFYSFFPSKEQFFGEVMLEIREQTRRPLLEIIALGPALTRDLLAQLLYKRYAEIKGVHHYFTMEEVKIITRRLPNFHHDAAEDSASFASTLLSHLPQPENPVNPHVVVNLMTILSYVSTNWDTLALNDHEETIRLMVNQLVDYIYTGGSHDAP